MSRWRVVMTDFTEPGHDIESEVFARSGLDIELVGAEESRAQGLAALGLQFGIARQDELCVVARNRQQVGMGRQIGEYVVQNYLKPVRQAALR